MGYLTILVERLHKCNICDFTGENFKNVILGFLSSVRLLANIISDLKDIQFIYILTSIKLIGTSIAPFYSILSTQSLIHPVTRAFIQCFYQFLSFSILLNDALTHTYTSQGLIHPHPVVADGYSFLSLVLLDVFTVAKSF